MTLNPEIEKVKDSAFYQVLMSDHYSAYVATGGFAIDYADNLARVLWGIGHREVSRTMRVTLRAENTAGRNGPDRRGRASAINVLKRAVEQYFGIKLVEGYRTYDEAYGFLHRTEVAYDIKEGK